MATGNEYRKVRALLAKTVAAGCTLGEAVSATETALRLMVKYGIPQDKVTIAVPEGYFLTTGDGGVTELIKQKAPEAPAEKPAKRAKASKPGRVTKAARLMEMLARKEGVTIDQLTKEFGILPHTARAMISTNARGRTERKDGVYHLKA